MKKTLVVVMFFSGIFGVLSEECGVRKAFQATIVNGEAAEKGEFPWMVAFIHKLKNRFFCAGSLISKQHVLSGKFTNSFKKITTFADSMLLKIAKKDSSECHIPECFEFRRFFDECHTA